MNSLSVVITGGEGDLAQALATRFEKAGWLIFAPARSELDVTDEEAVRAWFEALEHPPDLLINNAGVTADSPMLRLSEEDWDRVLQVNLRGAFLCARSALRGMLRRRNGHILQIGSWSALHPPIGQANYAAAKAGLIGLTRSLARECSGRNVRVNCVLPGFLDTKMTRHLPAAARERALGEHVLGRFNTLEEASRFIEFLHSMENVSGQIFQLDSRVPAWF